MPICLNYLGTYVYTCLQIILQKHQFIGNHEQPHNLSQKQCIVPSNFNEEKRRTGRFWGISVNSQHSFLKITANMSFFMLGLIFTNNILDYMRESNISSISTAASFYNIANGSQQMTDPRNRLSFDRLNKHHKDLRDQWKGDLKYFDQRFNEWCIARIHQTNQRRFQIYSPAQTNRNHVLRQGQAFRSENPQTREVRFQQSHIAPLSSFKPALGKSYSENNLAGLDSQLRNRVEVWRQQASQNQRKRQENQALRAQESQQHYRKLLTSPTTLPDWMRPTYLEKYSHQEAYKMLRKKANKNTTTSEEMPIFKQLHKKKMELH